MKSEVLLYGYGVVCLAMLVFNVVYNLVMKENPKRMEQRCSRISSRIGAQLWRVSRGDPVEESHVAWLEKKLLHINNLIAFDQALVQLTRPSDREAEERETILVYDQSLKPILLKLARVYSRREATQAAYFAYFIARHKERRREDGAAGGTDDDQNEEFQQIMVEYMDKDSLYCRINALGALYQWGDAARIVEALVRLERMGGVFHEKILTDGLLTFTGDHRELTQLLWENFDRFSIQMQLAVVNYVRFKSGDYCREMFAIMTDEEADKELRISAIRYFGKYKYEAAIKPLLEFAKDRDPIHWEYRAISLSSLASYSGQEVIQALMDAMYSANWYVRRNAAAGLESRGLDYMALIDVVGGRDRYAREMMMYQLASRRLREEGEGDWL